MSPPSCLMACKTSCKMFFFEIISLLRGIIKNFCHLLLLLPFLVILLRLLSFALHFNCFLAALLRYYALKNFANFVGGWQKGFFLSNFEIGHCHQIRLKKSLINSRQNSYITRIWWFLPRKKLPRSNIYFHNKTWGKKIARIPIANAYSIQGMRFFFFLT